MTAKQQHEIEEIVSSLTLQLSKRERDNIQQSLKGSLSHYQLLSNFIDYRPSLVIEGYRTRHI